jgi:hypothetical protein
MDKVIKRWQANHSMKHPILEKKAMVTTIMGLALATTAIVSFFIPLLMLALIASIILVPVVWYLIGLLDADRTIYHDVNKEVK